MVVGVGLLMTPAVSHGRWVVGKGVGRRDRSVAAGVPWRMVSSRRVSGVRGRTAAKRRAGVGLAVGTLLGAAVAVGVGTAAPTAGASTGTGVAAVKYYVALGDSLAAGVGSPDGKGYVADVYSREKKMRGLHGLVLENLGCSGATTGSMINGGGCSYVSGSQLGDAEAFLTAHPGQVAFVTVDIGANDVDGCVDAGTLTVNTTCLTNGMNAITSNLPVILAGLEAAGGPTPIVGMSYYDPFLAAWLLGSNGQSLARQSVPLADTLNGTLAGDYGAADTADVAGAFGTSNFALRGSYQGAVVPVNVGRICNWTLMCTQTNIHANDIGHAHIAKAFEKVLHKVVTAGRNRP